MLRLRLALLWLTLGLLACSRPAPQQSSADAGAADAWAGLADEDEEIDPSAGLVPPHLVGASNVPIPVPGATGNVLTSNGVGVTPSWQAPTTGVTLPDAGAGGLWYQGDGGPNPPVGFPECTSSQVLGWSGSANVPACITPSGDVTGSLAANTVGKIQGNTVTAGALTKGSFLVATTTSNWADTALSGDVTESAVTPGLLTVTGLQGIALPAPSGSSTVLTYNAGAYTWGAGGGSVTWANDLAGSSSTHQYVVNISGGSTPGTVTVTAPTLSASQASTWKTTTGALAVDSAAALNLGTSTATGIAIGNATNTSGISLTAKTGTAISDVIGSNVVNQQAQASTDFSAFGTTPGSVGSIRATANTAIVGVNGTTILQTDSGPASYLNGTGNTFLQVNGTSYVNVSPSSVALGNGAIAYALNFAAASTSATIGFTGAATGAGATFAINGQNATSGVGGKIYFQSGSGSSGNADGGFQFGFNGSGTDAISLLGATTSAGRGTIQWTSALTPVIEQVAISTSGGTAASMLLAPQQNTSGSGSTGASGSLNVLLGAPPGSSTSEAAFGIYRGTTVTAANLVAAIGPYPAGGAANSSMWLQPNVAPTSANYTFTASSSTLYIQPPSGGSVIINNSAAVGPTYLSTAFPIAGYGGSPYRWGSATQSVGVGGTTTLANTVYCYPVLVLTSSGTTTSQVVVDFSNASTSGFWILDTTGITFGTSLGISVKNGTTTSVVTSGSAPTGNMVIVNLQAANKIAWH